MRMDGQQFDALILRLHRPTPCRLGSGSWLGRTGRNPDFRGSKETRQAQEEALRTLAGTLPIK
jgi:hypothetical protein